MKPRIVGLVDFPHAARAERFQNLVGAEPRSIRQIHALLPGQTQPPEGEWARAYARTRQRDK